MPPVNGNTGALEATLLFKVVPAAQMSSSVHPQ